MPAAYSATVMNHFLEPRNVGTFPRPSGEGWAGSAEAGPFMRFQLMMQDFTILEARYQTYGCAPAIAAGSFLPEWVRGRTAAEALRLEPPELEGLLGGLPAARRHCAALAVRALRQAVFQACGGRGPC